MQINRLHHLIQEFNTGIWIVGLMSVPLQTRLLFTFSFYFFFFFYPFCLNKISPKSAQLSLWLSEQIEHLNSATRPLICDCVWETRGPSVVTCRELSAHFSLMHGPTAGLRPQHEKRTRQWPPRAVTADTVGDRNTTAVLDHTEWWIHKKTHKENFTNKQHLLKQERVWSTD